MPDRDPALEAALKEAYLDVRVWIGTENLIRCNDDTHGELTRYALRRGASCALRSLGAGTPEAQEALQVMMKALAVWQDAERHYTGRAVRDTHEKFEEAVAAFAALATPTEEGR